EAWQALGVEPGPFPSVRFWAPPRAGSGDVLVPDTGGRQEGVDVFTWTPREFVDEGLLQFLFTDAQDSRNQIPFVRERVQAQLRPFAVDVVGRPGCVMLRAPSPGRHEPGAVVRPAHGEVVISDLKTLVEALEPILEPEDGGEPDAAWTARVQPGTV